MTKKLGTAAAFVVLFVLPGIGRAQALHSWHRTHASWYGPCPDACGRAACTGKYIHEGTWGVAHRTLRCGTKLTICRRHHGCVHVRVIDRGPYVGVDRDLDITKRPAKKIGITPAVGVAAVRWRIGWR